MGIREVGPRPFTRNKFKPYCMSKPKAIQKLLQQNRLQRFLSSAQKFKPNANKVNSAPGLKMNLGETLLQAGSTKVDPILTPDNMNSILEEGFPVSKHVLRKLEASGLLYRPAPLMHGRQITQLGQRKGALGSAGTQFIKNFRIFPSKSHKVFHETIHPYCPRVPALESVGADFYNELRRRKDELIAQTAKKREKYERESLVTSKSVPSHPLFELPALPDNCEGLVKGGIYNRVPLATNLTPNDLVTLQSSQWLNGDAINASLSLLTDRSNHPVPGHEGLKYPNVFAFPTYFFDMLRNQGYAKVARQARKKQVFSKDLLLVPIHMGNHWTLLSIDFRYKLVTYFDSLLGSPKDPFITIKAFLEEASMDILKQPFDGNAWRFKCPKCIPTQKNGYDCGMFCIMFSKSLASPFYPPDVSSVFPFNQSQMQMLRLLVSYEVITGRLLHN